MPSNFISAFDNQGSDNMSSTDIDPIEQRIGNFSVMIDIVAGDLQIRVYPLDKKGQPWDCPFATFDVEQHEIDALGEAEETAGAA
jgi:hypothetical protein